MLFSQYNKLTLPDRLAKNNISENNIDFCCIKYNAEAKGYFLLFYPNQLLNNTINKILNYCRQNAKTYLPVSFTGLL